MTVAEQITDEPQIIEQAHSMAAYLAERAMDGAAALEATALLAGRLLTELQHRREAEAGARDEAFDKAIGLIGVDMSYLRTVGAGGTYTSEQVLSSLHSIRRSIMRAKVRAANPDMGAEDLTETVDAALAASPPAVAAGGVTEEMVEALARKIDPMIFGPNYTGRTKDIARSALTAALAVRDEGIREEHG